MAKAPNIQTFFKRFPTDDACLDHLLQVRYGAAGNCPKCGKHTNWSRIRKEPAYQCQWCGHHVHPMKGTPFERTRTPLQKWFFVMFLFTTTRNGVSAKEIQRQVGCTYKTAWRMGHEIRKYMGIVDGDGPVGGDKVVEADKSFLGGKDKIGDDKHIVLGMVERGGDVVTRVIETRQERHVIPEISKYVVDGSHLATDSATVFHQLSEYGYRHGMVNHKAGEYVRGPIHTNTIEGFWAWLKRGINGTHVWVSRKHLPKYLGEFEFRFNRRSSPETMFDALMAAFAPPKRVARR